MVRQLGSREIYERAERVGDSLVALAPEGDRPPIYFVHGAYGEIFQYLRMIPHLASDQPVYAFEASGLWQPASPIRSLEQLAHDYVEAMREVQPVGPYRIAGFSGGALLVWAMAAELLKLGERPWIASIDGNRPRRGLEPVEPPRWWRWRLLLRRARFHYQNLRPMPRSQWRVYLREMIRGWARRLSSLLGNPDGFIYRLAVRGAGRPRPPGHVEVWRAIREAREAYEAPKLDAEITVFRAKVRDPDELRNDLTLGWQAVASEVHVIEIPGSHTFVFSEPHGVVLARELMAWAKRADEAASECGAEAPASP